jgi:hypothetical protein
MTAGERRPIRVILALALALPVFLAGAGSAAADGQTREYYLAAEEVAWDFAFTGRALMHGSGRAGGIPKSWAGHTRARKVRYVEYTDASFATRKP